MEKISLTKRIFVIGLIVAIVVASMISLGVSMQLSLGPKGLKGDKGDTGSQGSTGVAGETGKMGPTGLKGVTGAIGATGAAGPAGPQGLQGPYTPDYDSGWIDITNKTGQFFTLSHNLNNSDVIVDIRGKTTATGSAHQTNYGLTSYIPGWSKTYGGTSNNTAIWVIQTTDGGYAMSGYTNSSGAGGFDYWLVKTDSFGNMQWNKTYGGTASDQGYTVVQTVDGGYLMAGTTSFGVGASDAWLVKIDSLGNMQWNKTYGTPGFETGNYVIQTSDGGYVVMGLGFFFRPGILNAWIFKIDSSGTMQWNKTYVAPSLQVGVTIVQTTDGGYAIAGAASASVGDLDVWLAKTDSFGNIQWNKTIGGTGNDAANGLILTSDGGYAIAGYTYSFGAGSKDGWLIRTDANGNMQWNKTYGGTGDEEFQRIVRTLDGGYAIGGVTNSFGAGGNDIWFVKIDSYGNMQWSKTFGGSGNDNGEMVRQTTDGGYAIVGTTSSSGAGIANFYLVKIGVEGESGLAWTDSTVNTITLYRGANDFYWNYLRVRIWKIH